MLKLGNRDAVWLDLGHGVRVKTRTPTVGRMFRMREQMAAAVKDASDARSRMRAMGAPIADDEIPSVEELLIVSFARDLIDDWQGVGDGAGNPAPCTQENRVMFAEHPYFGMLWWAKVQGPLVELLAEGEGSAAAPNGFSAAAATSAGDAQTQASAA